jgi:hypothetical protein
MSNLQRDSNAVIRVFFWTFGLVVAGLTAYTTRFFINGDAISYIEMGESLRTWNWSGLVNLTYSPGYPVLLGIAQAVLDANPLNELQVLRVVNFLCFAIAMASGEFLISLVIDDSRSLEGPSGYTGIPKNLQRALCYAMFLTASLVMVRIRLLNPDMLVLAVVIAASSIVVWIRRCPDPYFKFCLLGLLIGLGYIIKSFFLPFSVVFLFVAACCSGSVKKALPRILTAIVVMAIVMSPYIWALSSRLDRFTYGELGKHVYAAMISGQGTPIRPNVVNQEPRVVLYEYDVPCTRPSGFDICYWNEGLKPKIDFVAHSKIIPGNISSIITQSPWLIFLALWFLIQARFGKLILGPLIPPSNAVILYSISATGVGLYSLLMMEPRYIGSFMFLAFVGLTNSLRLPEGDLTIRQRTIYWAAVLMTFLSAMVIHSAIDQTLRGLWSSRGKPSYHDSFQENVIVSEFLKDKGLKSGDRVAIVGDPPVYWARMAGLKIIAEIPDTKEFLESSPHKMAQAFRHLKDTGFKVIVAKDKRFQSSTQSGWIQVPATSEFYAKFLLGKTDKEH